MMPLAGDGLDPQDVPVGQAPAGLARLDACGRSAGR